MKTALLDGLLSDLAIESPGEVALTGAWPAALSSRLAAGDCAVASVAACLAAAADLLAARGSGVRKSRSTWRMWPRSCVARRGYVTRWVRA